MSMSPHKLYTKFTQYDMKKKTGPNKYCHLLNRTTKKKFTLKLMIGRNGHVKGTERGRDESTRRQPYYRKVL